MTELERRLIARIRSTGAMTFRDFMKAALYDEELGYYNTERLKIGAAGDYYTSSNVHPAFGAVLARAFIDLWKEMRLAPGNGEAPSWLQPLTLIEAGAGTGQLAQDILTAFGERNPEWFSRLRYIIVETSAARRRLQQQRLAAFADRIIWQSLDDFADGAVDGILFSNELLDALPVHCVRLHQNHLQEAYVTVAEREGKLSERLTRLWAEPSSPRLCEYVQQLPVKIPDGFLFEVGLDAIEWLAQASRILAQGYLVTIDYGDEAGHLYGADRRRGTLRSFYRHRLVDSPLEQAGEQDITASVNFTALIEYGREGGLEKVSYERQSGFLLRNGLLDIVAALPSHAENLDDLKARLAMKNLFVPGGVSDNFRVLIQRKR